jgi:ABC-type nitrate/sulfonate/bicarbonate transport system substrate-binding protein
MRKKGITKILVFAFVASIFLTACSDPKPDEVIIRLGVPNQASGVAPLIIVDEFNLLEKYVPGVRLELSVIESSVAVNEAIIAGNIDGAAINNTNFLIGSERGIAYKAFSTLAYGSNSVLTNDPERIRIFSDITENDKIVLLNLTGSSALLLYLASERYFGSHDALIDNFVTMDVASGEAAFLNKLHGITVYAPSFQGRIRSEKAGAVTILDERDFFGRGLVNWNFVLSNEFYENHHDILDGLYSAMQDAIDIIENRDERAISIIAEMDGMEESVFLENLDLGFFKYVLDDFSALEIIMDIALTVDIISSRPELSGLIFESSPALRTGN